MTGPCALSDNEKGESEGSDTERGFGVLHWGGLIGSCLLSDNEGGGSERSDTER